MTPYSTLSYFLLIFLVLVPMIFAGWKGRADGRWIIGATIFMLLVQYTTPLQVTRHLRCPEIVALLIFGVYEWGLLRMVLAKKLPGGSLTAIPLGLLPLVVAKYLPEFLPDIHFGFGGISYVTFRALDMLWAATEGVFTEVAFLDFGIFLFFFPTISAGPIDRFRRFKHEWRQRRSAAQFWQDLDASVPLLMRGLLYKFVIATIMERYFLEAARVAPGVWGAVKYAYIYSAYLFFDFAGYSAFAIGVSRWFGISSPANFHLPWAARNIREFWNRWHMSLSFWFRDHVYSRFLLAAVRGKWFKKRETPAMLGYFVSFGLMGLWHGLTWFYILYGLYHATLMAGFDLFTRWKKKRPAAFEGLWWKGVAHLITIHVVIFGLWMFSGQAWQKPEKAASRSSGEDQLLEPAEKGQK